MEDIARRLAVSKNSVSLALNNKKGVGDELRQKIVDTAREMQYAGAGRDKPRDRCVVSIIPEYIHNDAYFYSDIFWSIETECKNNGCISIMTSITKYAENDLLFPQMPTEMDIIGFLVSGVVGAPYINRLLHTGLPVVAVDINCPGAPVRSVTSSNLSGGYEAVRYLYGKGHKDIGFIGPAYAAQSVYERWCGFNQALGAFGLEYNPGFHVVGNKNEFKLFDTVENLEPLINLEGRYPTAWFCAGDRIAIALLNILTRRGLSVPGDISIIGFDDIHMSQMVFPALTTMRVDRKLMGKLAFEMLLDPKLAYGQNVSLSVTIVERGSVKALS
jgi:LacI family transcriptional regulator/LacI family purine nucleotide synthesis repressor